MNAISAKNVGILAAMTLAEVGPASDVKGFFNVVLSLLENGTNGSKYPWIKGKLYRGSLAYDELYKVKNELDTIKNEFSTILPDDIVWSSFGVDKNHSRLNFDAGNLFLVFERFFKAFDEALTCTEAYYQAFNEYIPVRLGFTDAPHYIDDVNRTSEQYNALGPNEPPFWLR
ncbi:Imm70 family immunity protein [Leclercia sp. M50]|uniref:Imm70 family immunity protein n=1 Tax=Leclercia sp. M50 TaxID=3081258 RepID=UPI00301588DD